ncbi:hypothetical protein NM208_g1622 [Fusarium decemcellulare]|uniref:Uncharacterized protein n=1 Tax=Fusarium decemcellulare TaxID=57161 RepID=A0ACC1SVA3_9HYPO|nr:hypothetical protein NM208_g1622 [Fusarium decemcellulare]
MSLLQAIENKESGPKTPNYGLGTRSYKACATCRARKIRCIVEDRSASRGCVQCLKDGKECVFESKKRTYDTSTRTRKAQEKRARLLASESPSTPDISRHEHFNIQNSADALLFLSDAAARHGSDAETRRTPSEATGQDPVSYLAESARSEHRNESALPEFHSNRDAQEISESGPSPSENPDIRDEISAFRCRLFAENIVTPYEALTYVSFFFAHLYPFFPFVPDEYYACFTKSDPEPQQLRSLFEEDEILLGCIITVSSRYYHLPKHAIGGYERSCDIHSGCWNWTKHQVSKVVFEGFRPKSVLSVIEALLMLAEWVPKPIHTLVENNDAGSRSRSGRSTSSRQTTGDQLLQPAFRTDQVSWSYVGNAFLLLRCLYPGRRTCPVFKSSDRYFVTLFSCLIMSHSLARRLSRPALMSFSEVDLPQIAQAFHKRNERLWRSAGQSGTVPSFSLGNSDRFHDAFVELMQLLSHTQEVLHRPTRDGIFQSDMEKQGLNPRLVTLLSHFDMMNKNWKAEYSGLWASNGGGMSNFSRLMLLADFEYLRLYEFSLALGTYLKITDRQKDMAIISGRSSVDTPENDWEFSSISLAYYIEQAIDAAEGLLRLMIGVHSPLGHNTLRYASSRHYMKIVFAMKAMRAGIPSESYRKKLITTLKDTIVILKGSSIDAAHPALHYSIILRGLMKDIEQPKPSNTLPLIPLTIGPRDHRQSIAILDEINKSGQNVQHQNARSNNENQPQADVASGLPLLASGAHQWPDFTGYDESNDWPGFDESTLNWEDSIAQLDTDAFLQSLIGGSIIPLME